MKITNIGSFKTVNFGEVTRGVNNFHIATRRSLVDPKKTIFEGEEFVEDVFAYARKKAQLSKDFNLRTVIRPEDITRLTDIMDAVSREKELVKLLVKRGLLRK